MYGFDGSNPNGDIAPSALKFGCWTKDRYQKTQGADMKHAGALSVRMPRTPNRDLHRILRDVCRSIKHPTIEPRMVRHILRAARGRIGWLQECVRRLEAPDYWHDARLHVTALCTDTEIATRESRRGPRMSWRPVT